MDSLIIFIAKYLIIVPFLIALYVGWKTNPAKRKRYLLQVGGVFILAVVIGYGSSHIWTNLRPPYKDGATPLFQPSDRNGFPSDHTLVAAALALGLLPFARRTGIALLVLALIIGWSRVAAHVHHALDIAAAFLFAALAYLIVNYALRKSYQKPKTGAGV